MLFCTERNQEGTFSSFCFLLCAEARGSFNRSRKHTMKRIPPSLGSPAPLPLMEALSSPRPTSRRTSTWSCGAQGGVCRWMALYILGTFLWWSGPCGGILYLDLLSLEFSYDMITGHLEAFSSNPIKQPNLQWNLPMVEDVISKNLKNYPYSAVYINFTEFYDPGDGAHNVCTSVFLGSSFCCKWVHRHERPLFQWFLLGFFQF